MYVSGHWDECKQGLVSAGDSYSVDLAIARTMSPNGERGEPGLRSWVKCGYGSFAGNRR